MKKFINKIVQYFKNKIEERRLEKKYQEKLKEIKKKDPYTYD